MTWNELVNGQTFEFDFLNYTDCLIQIKLNETFIRFTDGDDLINRYRLIGFPTLASDHIEMLFDYTLSRPSGETIPLTRQAKRRVFKEYEIDLFAGATNIPYPFLEFGYKQSINGLTRRVSAFEGDLDQNGYMMFNMAGELVQPVTFSFSTTPDSDSSTSSGNGSINVLVLSGVSPFTYTIDGEETSSNITGLESGTYTIRVTDAEGTYREKQVTV